MYIAIILILLGLLIYQTIKLFCCQIALDASKEFIEVNIDIEDETLDMEMDRYIEKQAEKNIKKLFYLD